MLITNLQIRLVSMGNMLFRLTCLHQNGVALGMEALLRLGYTGYLVPEERAQRNRFSSLNWRARRPGLKAKGGPRDIVPPLYNSSPVNMLDMPDPQITLQGYERHVKGAT